MWAAKTLNMLSQEEGIQTNSRLKVCDLFKRYIDEVTVHKRSERWERIRLMSLSRMSLGNVLLRDLNQTHIVQWRNQGLKEVEPSTVGREWTIINNAFNVAVNEWLWLKTNPMVKVKRPKDNPPRYRRVDPEEIDRMAFVTGWDMVSKPRNMMQRTIYAFLFAIETGMRAGEILSLRGKDLDLKKRTAFLKMTKNGTSRTVPLTDRAVELLGYLHPTKVFDMSSSTMEVLFRRIRKQACVEDLHFHDSRHEAISRLARKLDVLDLARMVGHKKLNTLMVYYNPTAEEMVERLNR